jgi:arsenite-transporting ATPase
LTSVRFFAHPTRILFFTGKGGVGKTSCACAAAIELADRGKRVLLVSTDPASNLDEVLGVILDGQPRSVPQVPGLSALNIDPEQAAQEYRERIVGPYRGVLPESALRSIHEQLSGACTVEIAAFDEFSKLLGDAELTGNFDHIIFDTAPTGHTLRLLQLPAAWSNFIESNVGGTSCLGPLAGLKAQQQLYANSRQALCDGSQTTLVLVARPDQASLREAERSSLELHEIGVENQTLILNGIFLAQDEDDPIAAAFAARTRESLAQVPPTIAALPRLELPLLAYELVGIAALRGLNGAAYRAGATPASSALPFTSQKLEELVEELAAAGHGVIMTMGKGGVGKTILAARIASELAARGHQVLLTTTDPAAHVQDAATFRPAGLTVACIDPEIESAAYAAEILANAGSGLDAKGLAWLEEDLRSPCTAEIAVFKAFALTVARGQSQFVVIDTAPTGHTLLLLDAAESYHKDVLRKPGAASEDVCALLPRLRDPIFTRILLVTLAEATPIHEALQLEADLARAGIVPFAWVVNQSFTPLAVTDPALKSRQAHEAVYLSELAVQHKKIILEPWQSTQPTKQLSGRS